MIQINLLPHREIKRRARQKIFMATTVSAAVLGVFIVLLGHLILQKQLENQQARNQYLKNEIAGLDAKIEQIKQLKEETEALLARKTVVETLQSNRTETVHMLDEIVHQMPDGVYLKAIRQSGTKVTLEGYAQSNARVSTLMENLERSAWYAMPELLESKQVTVNNQRLHEFSLEAQLKYDAAQDTQKTNQQSSDLVSVPGSTPVQPPLTGNLPAAPSGLVDPKKPTITGIPGTPPANTVPGTVPGQKPAVAGSVHPSTAPTYPKGQPNVPPAPGQAPGGAQAPGKTPPATVLGLPTPQSVGAKVTDSLSSGQKRSMP